MKVLVCGDHPSSRGGMAVVMSTLEKWLQSNSPEAEGVECKFVDPRGQENWTLASSALALTRIAERIFCGVDLVHLNTASRGSTYRNIIIALMAKARRTPYLIHLHGGGYEQFMAGAPTILRRLVLQYFAGAVEVVALTPGWRDHVIDSLGVPVEKVNIIPNGTDAPDAELLEATQHEVPTFLFVGRLTNPKGVPELLRAFEEVSERTRARLTVVGGGADDETAAALATAPGSVEILGWVDHDRAVALMARARAVVLPSHYENMPLTVLESMSVRTAVIATRVGGLPDILDDGVEGVLVEPGDHEALRDVMLSLCGDPGLAQAMGDRGRQRWMRNYDSAVMSRRIVECWWQARA